MTPPSKTFSFSAPDQLELWSPEEKAPRLVKATPKLEGITGASKASAAVVCGGQRLLVVREKYLCVFELPSLELIETMDIRFWGYDCTAHASPGGSHVLFQKRGGHKAFLVDAGYFLSDPE